ncbi:hypothetical protein GCM10027089_54770 [Nocardia thraciensis]
MGVPGGWYRRRSRDDTGAKTSDAVEPFPAIEPYAHGLLEVGESNRIYWETSGNPDGKPALMVHGGPGFGRVARLAPDVRPGCVPQRAARVGSRRRSGGQHHRSPDRRYGAAARAPGEPAKAWPDARLRIIDDSGHTGSPAMGQAVLRTVRDFGTR